MPPAPGTSSHSPTRRRTCRLPSGRRASARPADTVARPIVDRIEEQALDGRAVGALPANRFLPRSAKSRVELVEDVGDPRWARRRRQRSVQTSPHRVGSPIVNANRSPDVETLHRRCARRRSAAAACRGGRRRRTARCARPGWRGSKSTCRRSTRTRVSHVVRFVSPSSARALPPAAGTMNRSAVVVRSRIVAFVSARNRTCELSGDSSASISSTQLFVTCPRPIRRRPSPTLRRGRQTPSSGVGAR